MENEVSGIAKLGIVLIALAILIGLGFGIFQISKSVANDGVGDVQSELDTVSASAFSTYDQKTITGTMVTSAVSDFEGESTAVLLSTTAFMNLVWDCTNQGVQDVPSMDDILSKGSGMTNAYSGNTGLPLVYAYTDSSLDNVYRMNPSVTDNGNPTTCPGIFINYNAVLGSTTEGAAGTANAKHSSIESVKVADQDVYTGAVYFDNNCWRCTSGFAANSSSGKVLFNNIAGNLGKTGRTEYVPSSAKFESYLIKDASGTNIGVAFEQIGS